MRGEDLQQSELFSCGSIDQRVPVAPQLRPIRTMVDKALQRDLRRRGPPSIAPQGLLNVDGTLIETWEAPKRGWDIQACGDKEPQPSGGGCADDTGHRNGGAGIGACDGGQQTGVEASQAGSGFEVTTQKGFWRRGVKESLRRRLHRTIRIAAAQSMAERPGMKATRSVREKVSDSGKSSAG